MVCPKRALARQVASRLRETTSLHIKLAISGEIEYQARCGTIIISTPGVVAEWISRGHDLLDTIDLLVFDEDPAITTPGDFLFAIARKGNCKTLTLFCHAPTFHRAEDGPSFNTTKPQASVVHLLANS